MEVLLVVEGAGEVFVTDCGSQTVSKQCFCVICYDLLGCITINFDVLLSVDGFPIVIYCCRGGVGRVRGLWCVSDRFWAQNRLKKGYFLLIFMGMGRGIM